MDDDIWRVIGESVRGSTHVRQNLPNQDAIKWHRENKSGLPVIMAVSDGHGSSKCFRSDRGARLAVDIAVESIGEFLAAQGDAPNPSMVKRLAEERLPVEIVRRWRQKIDDEIALEPFSEDELGLIGGKDKAIAYGATLLAVAVSASYALYLQLGDGDIVAVYAKDEHRRLSLPSEPDAKRLILKDERLLGNETTSLCTANAWRDMRCVFHYLEDGHPEMLMLATDGYANSFRSDDGFLKAGADIWKTLESSGCKYVRREIAGWLDDTSRRGSGDDITVGLITRMSARDILRRKRRLQAEASRRCPKYSRLWQIQGTRGWMPRCRFKNLKR